MALAGPLKTACLTPNPLQPLNRWQTNMPPSPHFKCEERWKRSGFQMADRVTTGREPERKCDEEDPDQLPVLLAVPDSLAGGKTEGHFRLRFSRGHRRRLRG